MTDKVLDQEGNKQDTKLEHSYIYSWITIDNNPEKNKPTDHKIYIAIVGIPSLLAKEFLVYDLLSFPYNPEEAIKALLKKKKVKEAYIDEEYYEHFIRLFNREVNEIFLFEPERRGKLPLLRKPQTPRQTDINLRYLSVMVANKPYLTVVESVKENKNTFNRIFQSGEPEADAVAGALMICANNYPILLENYNQQIKLNDEAPTWDGLKHIRFKNQANK